MQNRMGNFEGYAKALRALCGAIEIGIAFSQGTVHSPVDSGRVTTL